MSKLFTNPVFALSMLTLLAFSIFSISFMEASFATAYAQAAEPSASIPDSLTHSKIKLSPDLNVTINSGNPPSTSNFNLTKGYKIEPVLWNLSLSSSVAFDDKGNMYVAESGYAPGGLEAIPRILKIFSNGTISVLSDRDLYPPIIDMKYHDGKLYVANRAKITLVDTDTGKPTELITGLKSLGDYRNNQIAFGPDGRMYFGQGALTNSGVIGLDNYEWLSIMPTFYGIAPVSDAPGQNITLAGQNFKSSNVLTPADSSDSATTGGFVPYGNSTGKGQQIVGDKKCTACIISAKPDGTDLKVVAWGLRNPYGLAFDNNGKMLTTVQGADERGSRPIANDSDKIYSIDISNSTSKPAFYGWPDYFGNAEPVTESKFKSESSDQPLEFLMQNHPNVEKPLALLGHSVTITQLGVSNSSSFGFKAFAGEFGQLGTTGLAEAGVPTPGTKQQSNASKTTAGTENSTIGQKVIAIDPATGKYSDFLSLKKPDPAFRPTGVGFTPDGSSLYVVSFGKAEMRSTTPHGYPLAAPMPWFYKNTGVLWRITNSSSPELGLAGNGHIKPEKLTLSPELQKTINSGPPPGTDYLDLQDGYKIEPIVWGIDKPGSFAFDNSGNMYIASVGITYGKQTTTPAIYKVDVNGTLSVFVDRPLHGTLGDIEFNKNNGLLYVAHRNVLSSVNLTSGVVTDLVVGLPTSPYVTHPMGQIAFGPDGRVYFGVGGLSNTAVPDISDAGIGWIYEMPFMHEVPAVNTTLTGQNFLSDNFLTAEPADKALTGGMRPFGVPAYDGQVIKGDLKCTACIFSIKPDGSDLKVNAWGARNPFGAAFDDKGRLFWSNNGNDDKGIRRVTGDPDTVYALDIKRNNLTFFGWPDIIGMGESISLKKFNESPAQNYTNLPLIKNPPPATRPVADFKEAVALTQLAYSISDSFGFKGKMFVAEFGTSAPIQHIFQQPLERSPGDIMGKTVGQKVSILDLDTGNIQNFLSLKYPNSTVRPVGLQFTPDGSVLYIASIEDHVVRKVTPTDAILPTHVEWPTESTGVIWKVSKVANQETINSTASNPGGG